MALPFILGLAVGAGAVIAFNKSDKLKGALETGVDKTKELAACGLEKTKDVAADVKDTLNSTVSCIKDKKCKEEEIVEPQSIEIEKEEK